MNSGATCWSVSRAVRCYSDTLHTNHAQAVNLEFQEEDMLSEMGGSKMGGKVKDLMETADRGTVHVEVHFEVDRGCSDYDRLKTMEWRFEGVVEDSSAWMESQKSRSGKRKFNSIEIMELDRVVASNKKIRISSPQQTWERQGTLGEVNMQSQPTSKENIYPTVGNKL